MEVENDTKSSITAASKREPGNIFKFCPNCRSPNLMKFDGDVDLPPLVGGFKNIKYLDSSSMSS